MKRLFAFMFCIFFAVNLLPGCVRTEDNTGLTDDSVSASASQPVGTSAKEVVISDASSGFTPTSAPLYTITEGTVSGTSYVDGRAGTGSGAAVSFKTDGSGGGSISFAGENSNMIYSILKSGLWGNSVINKNKSDYFAFHFENMTDIPMPYFFILTLNNGSVSSDATVYNAFFYNNDLKRLDNSSWPVYEWTTKSNSIETVRKILMVPGDFSGWIVVPYTGNDISGLTTADAPGIYSSDLQKARIEGSSQIKIAQITVGYYYNTFSEYYSAATSFSFSMGNFLEGKFMNYTGEILNANLPAPSNSSSQALLNELNGYISTAISTTPAYEYVNSLNPQGLGGVNAIYYSGMPYGDKTSTKVFAYIGFPDGATEKSPVPAVVCLHGGGGKAYPQWVKYWTDRGYAAIAMDLNGKAPSTPEISPYTADKTIKLADGGPILDGMGNSTKLLTAQWMFHSVTQAILAENLLRSFASVDSSKIGITGISWGSHVTMNTISFDSRFAFAVPVYGSACLPDSEGLFSKNFGSSLTKILWDPTSRLAEKNTVPILLFNGDGDPHFSIHSTQNTYETIENATILIHRAYTHNNTEGWSRSEIYAFADHICKGTEALGYPKTQPVKTDSAGSRTGIVMNLPDGATMSMAKIYYMKTKELPYDLTVANSIDAWKGEWYSASAEYNNSTGAVNYTIPSDATRYYVTVVYSYNKKVYTVSTQLVDYTS